MIQRQMIVVISEHRERSPISKLLDEFAELEQECGGDDGRAYCVEPVAKATASVESVVPKKSDSLVLSTPGVQVVVSPPSPPPGWE